VMERLRALDEIAYIRFASVYRDFKTLEDLRAAMEGIDGSVNNQRLAVSS